MTASSDVSMPENTDANWRHAYDAGVKAIEDGELPCAIEHLDRAATLKPEDPSTNYHLGVANLRSGNYAIAQAAFETFRDSSPDNATAHHAIGLALAGQRERSAAIAAFHEAVSLDKTAWQSWTSIAETTPDADLRRSALDNALEALEAASRAAPSDDALFREFIRGLLRRNQPERAADLIRKNARRFEAETDIHDMLGRAYYRAGLFRQAFVEKQYALLKVDPDKVINTSTAFPFRPNAALAALLEVKSAFEASGIEFFLAAGTLLGFLREGAPLAHDRDVDVGVLSNTITSEEVVSAILRHDQFSVAGDCNPGDRYISFFFKDIAIDLFVHNETDGFVYCGVTDNPGDVAWRFKAFDISYEEFDGVEWPVPSTAETYLEESYGPDWRTPDKGFASVISSPALHNVDDYARGYYSVNRARHCLLSGDSIKARALVAQSPVPAFLPSFMSSFQT